MEIGTMDKQRHFVVYVKGFSEAFVVAESRAKARAKVAYALIDANYTYDFMDALRMIQSLRLTDEKIGSAYSCINTI